MNSQQTALAGKLSALATSTIANALDRTGCFGCTMVNLKPVAPGMKFAGPALTVLEESGPFGTFSSDDFRVGAMIDAASPGEVIVVAADGVPYSTWGGMASLAAAHKGIAGIAIDGGARDADETAEAGFSVFSRHLIPTTGRCRLRVADIGTTIVVDGVTVSAGDWIVADDTGILSIPASAVEDVITLAEAFTREDEKAADAIRNGMKFSDAMKKFGNI
ncbi:RraA family protein [Thalassospiraceae bacterium LMO-JJ14]|nr:RraA family protein [Thalassospiraceae bacterium LMO-JJ14]